jgi:hypothetical protein
MISSEGLVSFRSLFTVNPLVFVAMDHRLQTGIQRRTAIESCAQAVLGATNVCEMSETTIAWALAGKLERLVPERQ